jgi:serine protease
MGGMQVAYDLVVTRGGNTETCSTFTSTTCVISPAVEGDQYSATLRITNDHGTVNVGPITVTFTTSAAVSRNDLFFTYQWHLKSDISNPYGMKVTDAWTTESGSPNVYVAVLDTGITDHPDLNGNVVAGYDMVSDPFSAFDGDGRDADPSDPGDFSNTKKSSWHGTHVAGIIAAVDNNIGVIGIAPNVKIIPVRVLGKEGGTEADILAGLNWAAGNQVGNSTNPHPASVVNMSIGGVTMDPQNNPVLIPCSSSSSDVIDDLKTKGITVVAAAGNNTLDVKYSYPGNCSGAITVAASGKTGKPAFYSNFGNLIDISAPGGDYCYQIGSQQPSGQIYSTLNNVDQDPIPTIDGGAVYGYELGTSMAAPAVAGVVALMYSAKFRKYPATLKNANLVQEIADALRDSARDGVGSGTLKKFTSAVQAKPSGNTCVSANAATHTYGAGIIDAAAALANILN